MTYEELKKEFGKIKKIEVIDPNDNSKSIFIRGVLFQYYRSGDYSTKLVRIISEEGIIYNKYIEEIKSLSKAILKKDLKEALLSAYKCEQENIDVMLEIKRLQSRMYSLENETKEAYNNVYRANGFLDKNSMLKILFNHLRSVDSNFGYEESHGDIYCYYKNYSVKPRLNKNVIQDFVFSRDEDIAKWASPSDYSFLDEEYDGYVHVISDDDYLKRNKDYQDIINKYSKKSHSFAKHISTNYHSLSVGDKRTLFYQHDVYVDINLSCKEDSIDKIAKIILKAI